jgi:hypothetical protein
MFWQVRRWAMCCLCALLPLVGCCAASPRPACTADQQARARAVHAFCDRRSAEYDYVFFLRGEGVLAQKVPFPHPTGEMGELFWCSRLPGDLALQARKCVNLRAEREPPFELHDVPIYVRASFPMDGAETVFMEWFLSSNEDIGRFLTKVRASVVRDEFKITRMPPWAAEDRRIRLFLVNE